MTIKINRGPLILIAVFAVLLLLSLTLYFFADNHLVERVLFFPGQKGISGEMRRLPRKGNTEGDVELLVKEMLLGPFSIDHFRLVPEGTDLQSLFLREKSRLYVDFSTDLVVSEEKNGLDFREVTDLIKFNVKYNFPFIDEIILSVNGETLQSG